MRLIKRKPNQPDVQKVLTYKTSASVLSTDFHLGHFKLFSVHLNCENIMP